jgi:ribosomal protein L31
MTLVFKSSFVSVAFGTVSFFMEDGPMTVRVDVSQDLLAKVSGNQCVSRQERVGRVERHKRRFAQIAAAKYDEGRYESEVNVLVVRIGVDDVIEQAGQ